MEDTDKQFLLEAIKEVLTPEQIATMTGTPAQATPAAPEPIKMKIGGEEFTFKSHQEVEEKMNAFVSQASQQMSQLQAQAAQKPQGPTGNDAPSGFSMENWEKKVVQGQIPEAFRDVLAHIPEYQQTLQMTRSMAAQLEIYKFKDRHPELAGAKPEVGSAIEHIRQSLNMPPTADAYDAAYALATQRGLVPQPQAATPSVQQQAPPPPQNSGGYNPYLSANGTVAPPPVMSRGGDNSAPALDIDMLESLSTAEVQKIRDQMVAAMNRR